MTMLGAKAVHMAGIGGIGMSALAQYLQERGARVTGSDRDPSPTTALLEGKGIAIVYGGQRAENLPPDCDLLVYTEAVPEDNPERTAARQRGIPERSYFHMLGEISEGMRTVAVAGTHGKTTTTGMLARILRDAEASPTAIVGSLVRDFGSNYLPGTSDWFVVEACEYKRDFLTLSPEVLVITNLELDHTDYYRDLADVQRAFQALALKVPASGAIVTDPSNPNIAPILERLPARIVDYTREAGYPVRLPGAFNLANARAATAAARVVVPGLAEDCIKRALAAFEGTWRRFDYRGTTARGAAVYDDYAHHPTAVRSTVAALRARMEEEGKTGKLFLAFHPHLFSRTKDLLPEFATAFGGVDRLFVAPIYPAREADDGTMSNAILADAIAANGVDARGASFEEIARVLAEEPGDGDVIMTMGAGDIYKIADALAVRA